MSVYIKDMEMPTSCFDCPLAMQDYTTLFGNKLSRTRNSYACVLTHKAITSTKRNRFCPLVPVPEHGDLFDADALRHWILTEMASLDTEEDREFVADRLANELPTIIPADKEVDE